MTDQEHKYIPWEDINIMYRTDVYDGIIAGIIKYENKVYYLDCWDFDSGGWDSLNKEEEKEVKLLMEDPNNIKIYKNTDTVGILYNNNRVYYEPEEEGESKFTICRPRKFYIYELTILNKCANYLNHFLYLLLVSKKIFGNWGYNLYFHRISNYRFMHRKEYDKWRECRVRYHKNKIIGWTES